MSSHTQTLASAAAGLAGAGSFPAFVGFDGFIDLIVHPVARRRSMRHDDYEAIPTLGAFGDRIKSAAGRSTNIETVLIETRFGGNGPLLAGALASLGLGVTYAGAVGTGGVNAPVHPVFIPFAERCTRVVTLAGPSTTTCYEFADGKLMLNDRANVQDVTRETLVEAFGNTGIVHALRETRLIAIVNWSLLGGVAGIMDYFAHDVLLALPRLSQTRRIFIDLADPTPRPTRDLASCLASLRAMNRVPGCEVTLGMNLMEAEIVASAAAPSAFAKTPDHTGEMIRHAAAELRTALDLSCVVIHPREGAAAATREGSAWFDGPFCEAPKLSTGAGDHFGAGFALAQTLGLPIDQCLAIGTATSGLYVRRAASPTRAELVRFLQELRVADGPKCG
jgi:sugar/nucleoside kinase (ribokinase family)